MLASVPPGNVPTVNGSIFTLNGRHLAYALPAAPPRALLLVAHGCRNSGRNWFHNAPPFGSPLRSSLPEESCVTAHAIAAGLAVIAPSSSADCWSAADLAPVEELIAAWKEAQPALPPQLPLLLHGTSSGGYFAILAARHWRAAAISSTVMVPTRADVVPPMPHGGGFPPLQLIYMQRDVGKAKEADALVRGTWERRAEVEGRVCAPRRVTPAYFTERAGLSAEHSRTVHAALTAAGHLSSDGRVARHPQRGEWRSAVLAGLPKKDRAGLPQRSLQAAMDAIFQELDVAYAYHAATCEHILATLAFFDRHLAAAPGQQPGTQPGTPAAPPAASKRTTKHTAAAAGAKKGGKG